MIATLAEQTALELIASSIERDEPVTARGLTLEVRQVLRERANVYAKETRRGMEYCGVHAVGTWIVEVVS